MECVKRHESENIKENADKIQLPKILTEYQTFLEKEKWLMANYGFSSLIMLQNNQCNLYQVFYLFFLNNMNDIYIDI